METRHAGELEVLGDAECRALLAAHEVGRVAIVVDGHPAICPVNYRFDGNFIIFRTNWPMLARASLSLLAFQVDSVETSLLSGWSVMVQGVGQDLTDALDTASENLQTLPVSPWAPGRRPRLLRIVPVTITGHRFR